MRTINFSTIVNTVKQMCVDAAYVLPDDVLARIRQARDDEPFPRARDIIGQIIENANIAATEKIPICQDTGFAVFFVKMGCDVRIDGGNLIDAVNEGTRQGYAEGYLRGSIVDDPVFDRKNTSDNTPALVHMDLVDGDRLEITILPKGGGCENMSGLAMLKPADGLAGIIKFVRDTAVNAGGNPCPPTVIGVGIGGTADAASVLAKKALLRPVGINHVDDRYAKLESNLLDEINASGVGPQGLGGKHTALWVSVEYMPCHIASMPVAVSINCHAARRVTAAL
ncbi:MAG: fumarate hydratase [Chitinispirillia bacterium]|nr:fumarate hydratase [Chitinispirillia bacterium]MCL2268092.1 fumarate hydratase [Chitinispirillia bacterium]